RATQRRRQNGAGGLGGTAAGHPDHAAWTVAGPQRVQRAFVGRGGNRAHLGAGRRGGPQQAFPVCGNQALGVFQIDCPGGVQGAASVWAAISALTFATTASTSSALRPSTFSRSNGSVLEL